MRKLIPAVWCVLIATCAGCGSNAADYAGQARTATESLRTTIQQYDSAAPGDVAGTATTCRIARDALVSQSILASPPASGPDRLVGYDLKQAYASALSGFSDCAKGGSFDYLRFFRAASEFGTANRWLARARVDDPRT